MRRPLRVIEGSSKHPRMTKLDSTRTRHTLAPRHPRSRAHGLLKERWLGGTRQTVEEREGTGEKRKRVGQPTPSQRELGLRPALRLQAPPPFAVPYPRTPTHRNSEAAFKIPVAAVTTVAAPRACAEDCHFLPSPGGRPFSCKLFLVSNPRIHPPRARGPRRLKPPKMQHLRQPLPRRRGGSPRRRRRRPPAPLLLAAAVASATLLPAPAAALWDDDFYSAYPASPTQVPTATPSLTPTPSASPPVASVTPTPGVNAYPSGALALLTVGTTAFPATYGGPLGIPGAAAPAELRVVLPPGAGGPAVVATLPLPATCLLDANLNHTGTAGASLTDDDAALLVPCYDGVPGDPLPASVSPLGEERRERQSESEVNATAGCS